MWCFVWHSMAWHSAAGGMVQSGMVWCGASGCDTVQCHVVCSGVVRHDVVCVALHGASDVAQYSAIQCDAALCCVDLLWQHS